jgi:predicted kinase
MSCLYFLQGCPGQGKSTFAKKLADKYGLVICSADNYHIKNGVYNWDRNKIGAAHADCYNKCVEELMAGKDVIVDNTSLSWREISKYADLTDKYNSLFYIYRPLHNLSIDELVIRNTHNVPRETIVSMINRFIPAEEMKTKLVEEFPNLCWGVSYFNNIGDIEDTYW